MKATDFCFWLQGYFELAGSAAALDASQVEVVKRHLNLVFQHDIDPAMGGDPAKLQAIHDGTPQLPSHLIGNGMKPRC